jgi:Dam-replacing HTH domain
MFTIDSKARLTVYRANATADPEDCGAYVHSQADLAAVIHAHPGEWAVLLWNQLPGTLAIHVPPGERTAKFRNRTTATQRIWAKLCELYPATKEKKRDVDQHRPTQKRRTGTNVVGSDKIGTRKRNHSGERTKSPQGQAHRLSWTEELTTELRKRFQPGQDFTLRDIYELVPGFQRHHKDNHHIAARLRTTLAQDLRGAGVVKSLRRGQYRMV